MLLNRYEIEKYIHATAARADLSVVWHNDPNMAPATDGKNIYLKELDASATEDEANQLISSTIHEVEHCKHTDFEVLKNDPLANPENSVIGIFSNILEDDCIDSKNAEEFLGDRQIRSLTTATNLYNIETAIKELPKDKPLPKESKAVITMTAWQSGNGVDYYRDWAGIQLNFEKLLDKEQTEWYNKLKAGDYYDALKNLRVMSDDTERTKQVFALAKRIAEEVFDFDLEEEQKKAEEKAKDRAEAAKGKGKKGKGEEAEGKGTAKGKSGTEEGDEEAEGEVDVTHYRTFAVDQKSNEERTVGSGHHVHYDRDRYDGEYSPSPLSSTEVVDYVLKSSSTPRKSATGDPSHRLDVKMVNTDTGAFNNAVRRLLQIRSRGRWEYGVKRGSLHNANLYRLTLTDAKGYNERVFKKHVVSDTLDTCLAILVDISASMSGYKVVQAASAAAHISDTIGNTLHIPTEIVGFTENSCNNAMFIYRSFNCKHVPSKDLVNRMSASCYHMEQNADGDSILWEHQRIVRRKEKRKIMIVLSDGSPASSKAGDCQWYTREIVKQIEEKSPVDILAVGICDDNVKRIYKENYVIHDAADIETALLTIIKRKVL